MKIKLPLTFICLLLSITLSAYNGRRGWPIQKTQIEHSSHRSPNNFSSNSLEDPITTYCFFEKKPAIEL